jgi:excinuclease UvrABC helicase subunit UvrB
MREFGKVKEFFASMVEKFKTKRQASKYLNKYGTEWNKEHEIDPKTVGKRVDKIVINTPRSHKNKNKKKLQSKKRK